jgi:hypothetical protein
MRTFLCLLALLAIAASPLAYSQTASPTPAASASPKKRSRKASPSPAAAEANATAAASATPKKRSRKEATAAASPATTPAAPAAPSPTAKEGMLGLFHKKTANPTPAPVANQPQAPANNPGTPANNPGTPGNGQVWVNTESHVYHKAGSRFYGKTKQGKYMNEADAIKEGDHAAKNGD